MSRSCRERAYRQGARTEGLTSFSLVELESDLHVSAASDLRKEGRRALKRARTVITGYGNAHPQFMPTLTPLPCDEKAPPIIRRMLDAASKAHVGPMAAVAGAVAEHVGRVLLRHSPQVIVENGGDIFVAVKGPCTVRIFTDNPHFGDRICVKIRAEQHPLGICTSSGTIGHSLSFGMADAATVISPSAALADAAATAVGNMVRSEHDIAAALEKARSIEGITGVLVIIGKKLGAWGAVELVDV